ncbi:MAG: M42 family metallopeptidase [Akkermansiaceae bacterium]|nr:M42 family metallopeptidase [Akkermansiaceae bacterium]
MTKKEKEVLFELLETPSPTGFEMPGQRVWANHIGKVADEVECDAYGSAWARLKGRGKRTVMLEAHADEIGYIVKQVTEKGFLRIDRLGGSDAATGRGRRLRILGDKGEVPGVIGNTAIHLRKDLANEKAPKVNQLWVDVGAATAAEVASLGIRVGHPAVYEDGPTELNKRRIVSRALDNRVGGFIIAQVMKKVAAAKTPPMFNLVCLNSVQEEVGGHGATMATHRLMPDVCLVLDVTHATDTPAIDHSLHGDIKLGGGPTVCHAGANHPLVVERLLQVAETKKIPIQHEASGRFSGTDTDSIFRVREGVPSGLVSLPLRSMHSVVETADTGDIEETIKLMTAFVLSLKGRDVFHQKL